MEVFGDSGRNPSLVPNSVLFYVDVKVYRWVVMEKLNCQTDGTERRCGMQAVVN